MLHRQRLSLVDCERLRRPNSVLDLPAVKVVSCQIGVVLLREGHRVRLLEDADSLDEDLEDCPFGFQVQAVVPERYMNTRLESVVECLQMVGVSLSAWSGLPLTREKCGLPRHDWS